MRSTGGGSSRPVARSCVAHPPARPRASRGAAASASPGPARSGVRLLHEASATAPLASRCTPRNHSHLSVSGTHSDLRTGGTAPRPRLPAMRYRSVLLLAAGGIAAAGCGDAARVALSPNGPTALDTCTRCHGDPAHGNAAPPFSVRGESDTATM